MLEIRLFGRLTAERAGMAMDRLPGAKECELLCYLIVERGQAHTREQLATVLWPEAPPARSRKYLRQALWQLQGALRARGADTLLSADAERVCLGGDAAAWIDVVAFERACAVAHPGAPLSATAAAALEEAVVLYRGPLLDGWYQDWCLRERERQQQRYLEARETLAAFYESHDQDAAAIGHSEAILRLDPAHEGTHQRLMRVHYRRGNRSQALRQYDRCVIALDEELGVSPSAATAALYEQIRSGRGATTAASNVAQDAALDELLGGLRALAGELSQLQERVQRHLAAADQTSAGPARAGARSAGVRSAPLHLRVASPR